MFRNTFAHLIAGCLLILAPCVVLASLMLPHGLPLDWRIQLALVGGIVAFAVWLEVIASRKSWGRCTPA